MQDQGPRYWELDEASREIWDTTRGIKRGSDVVEMWGIQLHDAVDAGIITAAEYMGVLRKWTLMKNSSGGIRRSSKQIS